MAGVAGAKSGQIRTYVQDDCGCVYERPVLLRLLELAVNERKGCVCPLTQKQITNNFKPYNQEDETEQLRRELAETRGNLGSMERRLIESTGRYEQAEQAVRQVEKRAEAAEAHSKDLERQIVALKQIIEDDALSSQEEMMVDRAGRKKGPHKNSW